jgi:hypothetical protein
MIKRLGLLFMIIGIALLFAIWSPWQSVNLDFMQFLGLTTTENDAGLQVISLAGTVRVEVDGVDKGTLSPDTSPYFLSNIDPGLRRVTLSRISETGDYYQFDRIISFERDTDVVISYELGPSELFSQGQIIYTRPDSQQLDSEVRVTFISLDNEERDDAISIDGIEISANSSLLEIDQQYQVSISREGYETQIFSILPATQSERERLRGSEIIVEYDMFLEPVRFRNE